MVLIIVSLYKIWLQPNDILYIFQALGGIQANNTLLLVH